MWNLTKTEMSHDSLWHIKLHCNCAWLRTLRILKHPNTVFYSSNRELSSSRVITNYQYIQCVFDSMFGSSFFELIGLKGWNRSNFSCSINLHLSLIDFNFFIVVIFHTFGSDVNDIFDVDVDIINSIYWFVELSWALYVRAWKSKKILNYL